MDRQFFDSEVMLSKHQSPNVKYRARITGLDLSRSNELKGIEQSIRVNKEMVGTAGFEPTTTTPPVWCATRLRYAPRSRILATTPRFGYAYRLRHYFAPE